MKSKGSFWALTKKFTSCKIIALNVMSPRKKDLIKSFIEKINCKNKVKRLLSGSICVRIKIRNNKGLPTMTKTETVKQIFLSGNCKAALRIAKDFQLGISREEASDMQLAYECMVHGEFYRQLGTDIDEAIKKGIAVFESAILRVAV